MTCEKCGTEMKCIKDGHSLSWICSTCGNGVATSFFNAYETDVNTYIVTLTASFKASVNDLRLIAEISGCNYIEAKKKIESAPIDLFRGKAVHVKEIKKKMEAAGINFEIKPDFPY